MLRHHHRFYYALKPFLPWRLRIALRRITARNRLARGGETWPINQAAGKMPDGWPGWPDGKKFAVVLTHDVEGCSGLAKCRKLMTLERQLGFRSSFNLIPEGDYRVPAELRAEMSGDGFEVGVHDLKHDGKLFSSRRHFQESALHINRYIREWGASGYRSGFMLRNLDWFHDLDIRYDCSTFDTDPFELQPDGAGTIFPAWVNAPKLRNSGSHILPNEKSPEGSSAMARQGYVELPYTLPQDSTLFLVLRETSPETWLRKADWVASHGGMILVNVHPDYMQFADEAPSARTYPAKHYSELLEYLRVKYAGQYWQPLPKDIADYTSRLKNRPVYRPPKRVCMITHSFYESDNRVTRYAEALAARGDHVDVLALRRTTELPKQETIEGVHVKRLQDRFGKTESSKFAYLWPLVRFLGLTSWWMARSHSKQRYDLLHIHNMPDFLVYAGWYPRLTGAQIILDIHDIVPEFYASKFTDGKSNATTYALKIIERRAAKFADHVIVSNHLWLEKYQARTASQGKCSVFINNVDSRIFQPVRRTRDDGRQIVIFPGGLHWHQGLDIALRAFKQVRRELPQVEFHIYGDGNMKPSLVSLAAELGFSNEVRFFEPVGVRQVARIMGNADLGVVPKRADSFGNEAYSTKIMEFMSLGIPVVVSKTKIDQFYFNDSVVRFFESGNIDALAAAMIEVLKDASLRRRLIENAIAYSSLHSWSQRKTDYLQIVDELASSHHAEAN